LTADAITAYFPLAPQLSLATPGPDVEARFLEGNEVGRRSEDSPCCALRK
jgi:hypothetical protein